MGDLNDSSIDLLQKGTLRLSIAPDALPVHNLGFCQGISQLDKLTEKILTTNKQMLQYIEKRN